MAYEKILILEGDWADDISDTRSTARIYGSIETLLSLQEEPIYIIHRPMLSSRFAEDVRQFVSLPANQRGVDVIILSGHGKKKLIRRGGKKKHRRKISAIDGDIDLGIEIRDLSPKLKRSILILDACEIGRSLDSFKEISGALGVIGFSKEVNWIESSAFLLALLCKYQEAGVFQFKRRSSVTPQKILEEMKEGSFRTLIENLGVEYSFND